MTIYKVMQNIVIGMALVVLAATIVCGIVFGVRPYIVVSGSMEPQITTGSLCFVDKKDRTPKYGDIVAFSKEGSAVLHRVIGKDSYGFRTKGDNNNVADSGRVTRDQIIGSYLFSVPRLGYCIVFLRQPYGIAAMVILVIAFLLLGRFLETNERKQK